MLILIMTTLMLLTQTLHWRDTIPVSMRLLWQKDFDHSTSGMHLPPPNPFIPTDLSLVLRDIITVEPEKFGSTPAHAANNTATTTTTTTTPTCPSASTALSAATSASSSSDPLADEVAIPRCVERRDGFGLWHYNDTLRFPMPKIEIYLKLSSSLTVDILICPISCPKRLSMCMHSTRRERIGFEVFASL